MCHFKDGCFAACVDAKLTVIPSRDHFAFLENVVNVGTSVAIVGMRSDIRERIQRVVMHDFAAVFLLANEPIHALLRAVGEFVPDTHTGDVEVAETIGGREESPHVRE